MEKNYPCEKGALPTPITSKSTRKPWRRLRLIACLALFAVALHTLFTFPTRSLISTSTVATAVPPLDNEWWLRCGGLIPVPEGTYTGRLDKIEQALDGAVWVAEPGESVSYFLGGFGPDSWSSSERPFLIAIGKEVIILTPAFEEARAKLINLPDETKKRVRWVSWAESESPYATLLAALGDVEITLDGDVRSFIAEGIRRTRRHVNARGDIGAAVATIRERKDEREVGLMRCANEATLHAIRKTRERMYLGIHESQTRTILYEEMKQVGLNDYSALILFGPNAALPHGSGTDRTLAKDEMVLIDAGGRWGGYISDITRTFFLPDSEISDTHREVWEIVRAAQRAPANLLHLLEPGEPALFSWLDDRARETVKKGMAALGVPPSKGHKPDYTVFTHRLGHGIGLQGHESPYVVQGPLGERQILPGHSFTLEPGVYIPHDSDIGDESIRGLGVRLEDVVVVTTKNGRMAVEWLTGPVEKWGDI